MRILVAITEVATPDDTIEFSVFATKGPCLAMDSFKDFPAKTR